MKTRRQKPTGKRKRGADFLARLAMILLLSFSLVQNAFADIYNDATASGTYQLVPVVSGNSFVSTPVVLNAPTVELLKSSTFNDESGDGFAQLGETISYAFSVQNTGNVTLTNIMLSDPTVTVSGGPIALLAPAAIDTTTFTATYTLVAADLLALQATNSATVTATPPSGPNVTDVSDSQNPGDDTGADDDVTNTTFMVPIDAVDDDFTASPVNGLAGGTTPTVFTNDTLNGAAFAAAAVMPSITANGGITGLVINADGTLTIPAATPAATYTVNYQICESANLANCDTADVTVVVTAATIDANDDDFSASPVNGLAGGNTATVFTNDTLNGAAFAPASVTPSITANGGLAGVSINASGTLNVPAGTAAATYTLTHQICEVLNATNCDTADAIVVITAATIVANDDDFSASPVNGLAGGNTATVFTNDTLNGAVFVPADVTPSITATGGLTGVIINASGTLTVPAGTTAATYTVTYQICEVLNATNCDTANVTVVVNAATIVANSDTVGGINGISGDVDVIHVFDNDLFNGLALDPNDVTTTVLPSNPLPPELTFDPLTGIVGVVAGTPAGVYDFEYQICETLNPANCVGAVATTTVVAVGTVTSFTKKALVTQVRRGEQIPYVITATNVSFSPARIADIMPPGFDYVAGSATVNGVATEPVIDGRSLTFDGFGAGDTTVELILVATVAVTIGSQVNKAQLIDSTSGALAESASAMVTVLAEHVFDCGDIIGKVFDDRNSNGSQDGDEPGLAGVRLVTVKGVLITTDKHGRFHVACADIPDADIGSNFILRLDTRTLPSGFKMTTENPRIVRLTAGKMSKLNFGASITRLVRFETTEEAFAAGSVDLKAQWLRAVDKLMSVLATDKSTLRLTYFAKMKDKQLAADRIAAVEKLISERWAEQDRGYELSIETRVMGAK